MFGEHPLPTSARRTSDQPTLEQILAATLASLPLVGPARLRMLVDGLGVRRAWRVVRGEVPAPPSLAAVMARDDLARVWRAHATDAACASIAAALIEHDIDVVLRSDDGYPPALRDDFAAPAVLFARGDLSVCSHRRVGVIGTRAATAAGRHFAQRLARDLSENGVAVVSGLARGIDAAAHRGVIGRSATPPIAVVASGLDVVYPREHHQLWHRVVDSGVVISESPPGCAPDAFRFPLRNRILAALSEVLVVVESRATGGSMITVDEALKRGIGVMAVPGSPHNTSSAGTNLLISQGAATVCDATDVLVALGLDHSRHRAARDARVQPSAGEQRLLDVLCVRPTTFAELVEALGAPADEVAVQLGRLEARGWVVANGGWWEALIVA